jgi:hypothetical protein
VQKKRLPRSRSDDDRKGSSSADGFILAVFAGLLIRVTHQNSIEERNAVILIQRCCCGSAQATGGSLLAAVAVSTMLALSFFAVQQLLFETSVIPVVTPVLVGYWALAFYFILATFYFLVIYGAFAIYDRTSSAFKSLLVIGALYSVIGLLFALLIYAAIKLEIFS